MDETSHVLNNRGTLPRSDATVLLDTVNQSEIYGNLDSFFFCLSSVFSINENVKMRQVSGILVEKRFYCG